jgi:hypothetical protein
MPDPAAIVRFYRHPGDIIREYIESDFARDLATEHERKVALVTAEGAEVTDAESYKRVGDRLVDVAAHRKDVEAFFKPLKDWAYRFHRMITSRESEILAPLTTFEATGKANRIALEREDERKRKADADRIAEQARIEEQARLDLEAEFLRGRGELELADQVAHQAAAVTTPAIVIPTALPQTKGVGPARENWQWQPTGGFTVGNEARSVDIVAAWCIRMRRNPSEFLTLDARKMTAFAKAHGNSQRIPGLEFYDAGTMTVRT